jgi:hypothetical protein
MSARNFESPDGTPWSVWEVIPGRVSDFRSSFGSHLPRDLADGWLCFDCGAEKRRLAPLPEGWAERPEADLWSWCRAAVPVRARPAAPAVPDTAPEPAGTARAEDALAGV